MAGRHKETTDLIRRIEAAGGEVRRGRSGHWKVYVRGHLVTTLGTTVSDVRASLVVRTILRRHGVELPRK